MFNKEYDRGVNTYSPEGRIHQVEYAMQALKLGQSVVGITAKDGIVIAVERKLGSPLMVPISLEKIAEVDSHVACAASGLISDAKTLINFARVEAQNHRFIYSEPMSIKAITTTVSDLALNFGEGDATSDKKPMSRPYGVGLLIAGIDETGPCIYQTDPSGNALKYKARGIGSGEEGIQNFLQENFKEDLTLDQAEKLAISCLKSVMQEKISRNNCELVVIPSATRVFTQRTQDYIEDIIKNNH